MGKLFDIKNENWSNEPTNEEIHFIAAYLEKQFAGIENSDLGTKTNEEKQVVFEIIHSIKNAVADLLSPDGGNYYKLLIGLNKEMNFETRLSNIIEKLSRQISEQNKSEARIVSSSFKVIHNPSYGYKTMELNDYLNTLLLIPPLSDGEIESQLKSNDEHVKSFRYLSDYLKHLVTKYSKGQSVIDNQYNRFPIVFFIRDTLLLYLGAKRLQEKGLSIVVKAMLINRKLIHSFLPREENNSIYKRSYNLIFQLLSVYRGRFSTEFIERYYELYRGSETKHEIQLAKFVKKYCEDTLGNKNKFIGVDTAAHGTMPLLTHVATGRLHSLELFTSKPWLYEFFSSNIFSNKFIDMRSLESFVCQEELFEFAYISKGRIYVNETCDPVVVSKSKFEIGLFLNIIDKSILVV